MTHPTPDELTAVGMVTGTHGLRGDLRLRPLPTTAAAMAHLREIFLEAPDGSFTCYRLVQCKPHKQQWLIRLAGLATLDVVQPLVGRTAWARRDALPELPPGEHYWHELDGLTVIDRRRGPLGHVVGLFATGAHDVLTVAGPYGEVLIPYLPFFVVQTDLVARELRVDLPDGLVAGDDAL